MPSATLCECVQISVRPHDDLTLQQLSDEELVLYLRGAREHGDVDGARLALRVLVFGYMDHVRARVALKVPRHAVDEVAGRALLSAISGAFRGASIGEFRAWLHVIVDRRIADFHRTGKVEMVALARGYDAVASLEDETGAVVLEGVVEKVMAELSETHRAVVERYVFDGFSAEETARELARLFPGHGPKTSPQNVHKLAQRFRDRVRAELGDQAG